jgi:hypothetical protein
MYGRGGDATTNASIEQDKSMASHQVFFDDG